MEPLDSIQSSLKELPVAASHLNPPMDFSSQVLVADIRALLMQILNSLFN